MLSLSALYQLVFTPQGHQLFASITFHLVQSQPQLSDFTLLPLHLKRLVLVSSLGSVQIVVESLELLSAVGKLPFQVVYHHF